jgi:hypothetical protein
MSKLTYSIKTKYQANGMNVVQFLFFLNLEPATPWHIIFYRTIIQGVSYEKAGEEFGISKQVIYERLKRIERRLDETQTKTI